MSTIDQPAASPIVKSRTRTRFIFLLLRLSYWLEAIKVYRSLSKASLSLARIYAVKKKYFGKRELQKIARVGGRYFWVVGGPSLFSPASKSFIRVGLNKMLPHSKVHVNGLQVLFLAVTRKCPLRCEHCFEGENLGTQELLSREDLVEIIRYFQDQNVAQIQFSGGEPMSRYQDLLHLLRTARPGTDFWMNTSGFMLDQGRAQELKSAGLTGCIISLDHYLESGHNRFRKNPRAFKWAIDAIRAVVSTGLPVTLSLCATREFISTENMLSYAAMARNLGATFIQVLEPKSTGFYKGKDVKLDQSQKQILEDFYWSMAFDPQYRDWPIVNYHEYHRHAINCGGAGDRFLYINSVGGIQACPFCDKNFGHFLKGDHQQCIQHMKKSGCVRVD